MQQVDREHYDFFSYTDLDRWSSYWYQLKEILSLNPLSVLEVGAGDKVVASYLLNNTNIDYKNVDIASDLKPDMLGDVRNLPTQDKSFDAVCAFEVLEHLPFDDFPKALRELKRVSKKYVILSLPHWGRHFAMQFFLPKIGLIRWQHKFHFFVRKHQFHGQHYWEIGKAGYSLKKIKEAIIRQGFIIDNDYIAFASPYHHFFVLSIKS